MSQSPACAGRAAVEEELKKAMTNGLACMVEHRVLPHPAAREGKIIDAIEEERTERRTRPAKLIKILPNTKL